MKKIIFFTLIPLFLSSCSLPFSNSFSAIQVESIPKATVYIDNKEVGKTPLLNKKIPSGEHSVKIVADSATYVSWQATIKFTPKILTAINRVLAPTEILSSGEIITMEELGDAKSSELAIISNPDGAKVAVDNNDAGLTPFAQKNTAVGERSISISMPGYNQIIRKVNTKAGYRLIVNFQLSQILTQITPVPDFQTATQSATMSATAAPTKKPEGGTAVEKPRIKVLETDTGWLRVRASPAITGEELGKIYPGEYFPYLDEQSGWVKIKFEKDKEGWVSIKYVEKEF